MNATDRKEPTMTDTPTTSFDPVEAILRGVMREEESIKAELRRQAISLSRHMAELADRIDALLSVNSLGEVQRQGDDIDRLCALLDAKRNEITTLRAAIGHAAKK